MSWLNLWWRLPDHYDELSSHLQVRGTIAPVRVTVALVSALLALVALATLWSVAGPRNDAERACAIVASAGATLGALLWARGWPTRTQAVSFAVLSNASILLATLAQHDPGAAMVTCATFATLAGYLAIMHSAPLMTYNFVVAALIGAVEGVRLTHTMNVFAALCAYSVVLLLNLAIPVAIQTVVHVLGADAVLAEHDQLTGLLNRHAFRLRATARLEQGRDQLAHFVVTVIDLDRFKQLNDTYGHSAGDQALTQVARALRDTTDETAIIGRSGGEEFVIAQICHPDEVERNAQKLCASIAALSFGITASIGTAGVQPSYRSGNIGGLLTELSAAADAAMYVAKRRGGNQAGHHHWPLPSPLDLMDGVDTVDTDGETDYRSDGISA